MIELGVLALLVRGSDERVSLILEPFADAELVFCCAEKLWDLEQSAIASGSWQMDTHFFGVLLAVVQYKEDLDLFTFPCQRSDAPKIVPQCGGPARQHAGIVRGARSSGEGRAERWTREAAQRTSEQYHFD